ncbi:hypothetical protein COB11_06960 [Candidatus Aerophobetes bacterium]|uniref:Uncharacterized protein n=1 Tax=Aerophobetes bacterium TaxID=2030807 RepID=A0A2A4YDD3_UNCAE|nr:MAG: hypothetical protein COB11_06960 [Candidatus Aerophobetes bacterium]
MNQDIVKAADLESALLAFYNLLTRLGKFSETTLAEAITQTTSIEQCVTLLLTKNLFDARADSAVIAKEINPAAKAIQTAMTNFLIEETLSKFAMHPLFSSDEFTTLVAQPELQAQVKSYNTATKAFVGFEAGKSQPFTQLKLQGPENVDEMTFENLVELRKAMIALETSHAGYLVGSIVAAMQEEGFITTKHFRTYNSRSAVTTFSANAEKFKGWKLGSKLDKTTPFTDLQNSGENINKETLQNLISLKTSIEALKVLFATNV